MNLWQDVRFGARLLVKDRWFTLAAATALALGIGANAAVFTFVNAALLRGLPFHDPTASWRSGPRTTAADNSARRSRTTRTGGRSRARSRI